MLSVSGNTTSSKKVLTISRGSYFTVKIKDMHSGNLFSVFPSGKVRRASYINNRDSNLLLSDQRQLLVRDD